MLPFGYGLSFFWCARLIFLFLVSFEFGKFIFNGNKSISLVYGFIIALSPMVQWWYAVCYIAEMFIFGQGLVVILSKYLKTTILKNKVILAMGLFICAGGYIFSIYPAWQVPLGYVWLIALLFCVKQNWQDMKLGKYDLILALSIISLIGLIGYHIYTLFADTVSIVKNTVYPGARFKLGHIFSGKDFFINITNSSIVELLPFFDFTNTTNNSESARIFDLFPLGIIYSLWYLIKYKKRFFIAGIINIASDFYIMDVSPFIVARLSRPKSINF